MPTATTCQVSHSDASPSPTRRRLRLALLAGRPVLGRPGRFRPSRRHGLYRPPVRVASSRSYMTKPIVTPSCGSKSTESSKTPSRIRCECPNKAAEELQRLGAEHLPDSLPGGDPGRLATRRFLSAPTVPRWFLCPRRQSPLAESGAQAWDSPCVSWNGPTALRQATAS